MRFICVLGLLFSLQFISATDDTNSLLIRRKRHSFKHGNCQPITTVLGQEVRVLHESDTHVREEKFYVRPRSTFRKIILQMKLNFVKQTFSPPKIYNARVEYTIDDLEQSNYTNEHWIPVVAKFYKEGGLIHNNFILRLKVGNVIKETKLKKLRYIYSFESLVFSGEGGGEWSFDCHPNHVLGLNDHGHATPFDWWMFIAVSVIVILLVIIISCCCIVAIYKCCKGSTASASLSKLMKSKRNGKNLEDPIYAELSTTSLQKLQRRFADLGVEGFTLPPAPRSMPSYADQPGTTVTTVAGQPIGLCEVQDNDWYSTLEQSCSSNKNNTVSCGTNRSYLGTHTNNYTGCGGSGTNNQNNTGCYSVPKSSTRLENHYSNEPKFKKHDSGSYLDMTRNIAHD